MITSSAITSESTTAQIPLHYSTSETNPKSEIPPPQFPIVQLPSVLRDFATSLAAAAPISVEFAATTCLGVLSAALGSGAVHHDGERRIRPNLYLLTVAPSTLDTATCHRLAYAPLADHQTALDQVVGPEAQPELSARRAQLQLEWSRLANAPYMNAQERTDRLFANKLAQGRLDLEAQADPHVLLTQIPRGKLLPHLAARPTQSVALFNPDATRPAQILTGRLKSTALDETVYTPPTSAPPSPALTASTAAAPSPTLASPSTGTSPPRPGPASSPSKPPPPAPSSPASST
jgi:hypothetical protein